MQIQVRRYGGLAALVCGLIWGLGLLCFVLFFALEAPQALRDAAQGIDTFALFGFLSDFLPILAFPAHLVLILVLYDLERDYEPRLSVLITLLGIVHAMMGTANGLLTVLDRLTVAQGAELMFTSYFPGGLWFVAVNAIARREALLPSRVTRLGIIIGLGQLLAFVMFIPFGVAQSTALSGTSVLLSNYLLLAALAIGSAGGLAGWLGPLAWVILLARALLASVQFAGRTLLP